MNETMEESGSLIVGCQASWQFRLGVFSSRGKLSNTAWRLECERVAAHLGIAPEKNLGVWAEQYAVYRTLKPLNGLLADALLIWVVRYMDRGRIYVSLIGVDTGVVPTYVREVHEARTIVWQEAMASDRFAATADGYAEREAWVNDQIERSMTVWWYAAVKRVFSCWRAPAE